ncbi:up-regulator of cell proliferation [Alosa pseudoharengus]|uniref:up-regulator of cell proliferation n=1 Tax=Alosa pseudoharengus TaxID=34774 RepID=UPI003F8B6400
MSVYRKESAAAPSYSNSSTLIAQNKALGSVMYMLGMRDFIRDPMDVTSILYISNLTLEDETPPAPNYLLQSFLRRLWLYHPDARNPSCSSMPEKSWPGTCPPTVDEGLGEELRSAVNPLDLVTGVYMSSNSLLRQEITNHMVQCNFAVPLLLPAVWPDVSGTLLLWPFRGVMGMQRSTSANPRDVQMKNMACSRMPLISCVRLGSCGISKSRVLNRVLSGPRKKCEFFVHRDMDGGQLPRSISEGMVEVGWNLPLGDPNGDTFSRPILLANLRGDAAACDRPLSLVSRGSGVLVVFFEMLGEKELAALIYWRSLACHMILVDCSRGHENASDRERLAKFLGKAVKELELEEGMVVSGCRGDEEELAVHLIEALDHLIPHLHAVNLVDLAGIGLDLSYNVDEDEICRKASDEAEGVLKGMEDDPVQFKEEQLPLQGAQWKRLAKIEKEQCRNQEGEGFNQRHLKEEEEYIRQQMRKHTVTPAMKGFIDALTTINSLKRAYFLSWMKTRLGAVQWDQLSQSVDPLLDQQPLVELEGCPSSHSFLGLEHFFREMGVMYEMCYHSACKDSYITRLPNLAAELLMHGVPLEIYDGDASCVPINWVNNVLIQLQKKLSLNLRLKVITAFGLHNSKNADILTTLFGASFLKGSYRHAKGAYMLLVIIPEMQRWMMECDLLLLINMEGLSYPELAEGEDSLAHDHELATFVTGLSDVLLLNLKAENQADVKDTRQIAVSALLRTKEMEKMPVCQLMSQCEGADTKALSLHMSRVIMILSMERTGEDLDSVQLPTENSNPCIMGPWNDRIVYLPLNPECSKAALELKNNLFSTIQKCAMKNEPTRLPQFMESIYQLWEAIKHETFPIPFNNTEVADTFSGVCNKLLDGEQNLESHMQDWLGGVDHRISDLKKNRRNSEAILKALEDETTKEIKSEGRKMQVILENHFNRNDINFKLVDAYKPNFLSFVNMYQTQKTGQLNKTLESATDVYDLSAKVKALQTAIEAALEVKLRALLADSRVNDASFLDSKLEEEFASVWDQIPTNLEQKPVEVQDIVDNVKKQLRNNLRIRVLQKYIDKLEYVGKTGVSEVFEVRNDHFGFKSKVKRTLQNDKKEAPKFANRMVEACDRSILENVKRKDNYKDSYTTAILEIVDKGLSTKDFNVNSQFEIDLKVYVCNKAALAFLEMQNRLIRQMNSKEKFLHDNKKKYMLDFMYQFRKRDQCQTATHTFINLCLKPAAHNYIQSSLRAAILEDILQKDDARRFISPSEFHYNILRDLISEDNFERFLEYLQFGETFSRKSIQAILIGYFSGTVVVDDRRKQRMEEISDKMLKAVNEVTNDTSGGQGNIREMLLAVCDNLTNSGGVNVPQDTLEGPLFDINTHRDIFVANLRDSLNEINQELSQDLRRTDKAVDVSSDLPDELLEALFDKVKGCGRECPFCKAPCDMGDKDHTLHSSLWHRPKGLLSYHCSDSANLSHSTCSQEVSGKNQFLNKDTGDKPVPYKDYHTIYPDWYIPEREGSSTYWKYILMKYNQKFAQAYQRDPADIPMEWERIQQADALESLRKAFHS